MTIHTRIPEDELEFFKSLENIKVVIDVGARADIDYLELNRDIELHAFEPNPEFFQQLKEKVGDKKNVYVNNIGLGDREEDSIGYNHGRQAFIDGEEPNLGTNISLPLTTLDRYVAEHDIQQIDFLKIDTEGYDFKVLLGAHLTIPKCRYIQYEYWNNREQFHALLERDFIMTYIGGRNVLCKNKHL